MNKIPKNKIIYLGILIIILIIIPTSFATDINNTNTNNTENTNIIWEKYGYEGINTSNGVCDDDLIFAINEEANKTIENNLKNIYGQNITKFYYTNESVIYGFELDGKTYYHIYSSHAYIPLDNIKNITLKKSYIDSYEIWNPNINYHNVCINCTNLTKNYNDKQGFKITINSTEDIIIPITLTRLSTKESKTYIISNNNGTFNLPINLACGIYTATIPKPNDLNNTLTYTIIVKDSEKTPTLLKTSPNLFNNTFKGSEFKGTLQNSDMTYLPNETIEVKIIRTKTNAEKTYILKTDSNGVFTLPINLAENFDYEFICTYKGNDKYLPSQTQYTKIFKDAGIIAETI